MTYLLDTMIVSYFLQAQREAELAVAASRCQLALVDEVRDELDKDSIRGGSAFKRWLASSGIAVRPITVGSQEHATFAKLLSASNNKGRGERASIALAAFDPSLTLVTHDKGGMWTALRELWAAGERLIGVPVFLRRLYEQGALTDPLVLDDVISLLDQTHRPTWWAAWRAGPPAQALPAPPPTQTVPTTAPTV